MSKLFSEQYLEIMDTPVFEEYTFWDQLSKRRIFANEDIKDNVVEKAIIQIMNFNDEDENIPLDKRKPIKIYINTLGGHVDIGLVFANVIKQSKTPIHTIALGNAASMGAILLMAGHKRSAYSFSNILIHSGSTFLGGTSNQVQDTLDYYKEKEKHIKDFILKNTKITEEKYKEMFRNEWWMTSETALENGIIDEIIGSDNNGN